MWRRSSSSSGLRRKAIGATRGDITSQFLAEVVALTVTGGIIGVLFGWYPAWRAAKLNPIDALRYQ